MFPLNMFIIKLWLQVQKAHNKHKKKQTAQKIKTTKIKIFPYPWIKKLTHKAIIPRFSRKENKGKLKYFKKRNEKIKQK